MVDEQVTFDGRDSSGSIEEYNWYIDGDWEADGKSFTWSWDKDGRYVVELEVKDGEGNAARTSETVEVSNSSPTAKFSFSPSSPVADEDVVFDGTESSDSDGSIVDYGWYIDGDWEADGKSFTWSWDQAGTHTIELEVTDNGDKTDRISKTVTISNENPTAEFSYSPSEPVVDQDVVFDASASSDTDGSIEAYNWYIDGDWEGDSQTFTWSWDQAGTHTIELKITDNGDKTDTASKTVTISNEKPTAEFSYSPSEPVVDQDVVFDAGASSDTDGSIEAYNWYIDGDWEGDSQTFTWSWDQAGTHTIELEVTDNGDRTDTASKTVTISNKKPTAAFSISPSKPKVDQNVVFDASASSDVDGSIEEYNWYIDEDWKADGRSFTWSRDESGTSTIELKVTDNGGKTDTASKTLTVGNKPPEAKITFTPSNPNPGEVVEFDGSQSTDPDGDIIKYEWKIDGRYVSKNRSFSGSWDNTGRHEATLTVTDSGGIQDTVTRTVQIDAEPKSTSSSSEADRGDSDSPNDTPRDAQTDESTDEQPSEQSTSTSTPAETTESAGVDTSTDERNTTENNSVIGNNNGDNTENSSGDSAVGNGNTGGDRAETSPLKWLNDALGGRVQALIAIISTAFISVAGTLYAIFTWTEQKKRSSQTKNEN